MSIPDPEDSCVLRHVRIEGFRLLLWDTERTQTAVGSHPTHRTLGYAFYEPGDAEPLFTGEDYGCPLHRAVDSDETVRELLAFLTLRPGDTDADYFAEYTERQLAFANGPAEELACTWADDAQEPYAPLPFEDIA